MPLNCGKLVDFFVGIYEDITAKVLFDGTDYDTSITAIQKIIDSNIF